MDFGLREITWNPISGVTLQQLINSMTGTAAAPYTIKIPPGTYGPAQLGTAPLLVKPWVNLKGAGGRGRVTIFSGCAVTMLDAAIPAGVNRWRMEGIRLQYTSPLTLLCTAETHTLVATIEDCPMDGNSPLVATGNAYGAATTMINLELRNLNLDHNTIAQMFTFCRVSFWSCTCLGMYFTDSDAYWFGCDLSSGCNVVNAGVAGGWFEFNGCKIDTMALNDPTSESVLATLCGGGNENVQLFGTMHGAADPNAIANWARWQPGALYYRHANSSLYAKTGVVGDATWTVVGP